MKLVTRDTDYALQAVIYIARRSVQDKDVVVGVDSIVGQLGLPKQHLRLLLKRLAKENILKSYRGPKGGFSLALKANKINMADIMKIFQGKIDITECLLKKDPCPNIKKKCKVRARLYDINKIVEKELKKITIAELL